VNTEILAADLTAHLPAHLALQRWYGGKGQPAASVRVAAIEELRDAPPALVRVVLECGTDRYQLLLGVRPPSGDDDPRHTVCRTAAAGGPGVCVDALADPALAIEVLHVVVPEREVHHARPMGVEQSNTSLVYDERLVLKVFRRLASPNPEVEMTVALAAVGFESIAEPLAVWREGADDLALLQRFLPGGVDGWSLALASAGAARDGAGLDSAAVAPFFADLAVLGDLTARMHLALAAAFGTRPAEPHAWVDAALGRVDAAGAVDADVGAVRVALGGARDLRDAGRAIRIHGDYHLGQVVRSAGAWFVLDFEGEPTRPVDERRAFSSPLRDVAGMVRSLAYAAGAARLAAGLPIDAPVGTLDAWGAHARDVFLDAFVDGLDGFDLLPVGAAARRALLDVFELDKAVYELAYERDHRPDWAAIPGHDVGALLARSGG
jgi:maltokinase